MATITVSDNTTGSTVGGIEDNELTGFNTTQQLGTGVQAYIDAWQGPDVYVTFVMRIPIPSGSGTVSNAKLRLYMTEKGGVKTALSLYEILRTDWSESQSTYNIYKTGNNWTTGGAQGAGTDRSSSAIATCNVSGTSVNNYIEFTGSGLTALIQSAVDGAVSSINVIVQFTDLAFTSQNYVRFRTSEGTDGQRPQLVYDLTASGSSGTIAVTTGNDTSTFTGTTTVVGSSSVTTANDTSSITATTTVVGNVTVTTGNDTSSISATTTILGTVAVTTNDDTSSISGSVGSAVDGTISVTTADDTSSITGTTTVTGSIGVTTANDTSSITATTNVNGTIAVTTSDDTSSISGYTGNITGTISVTTGDDVMSAVGIVPVTDTQTGVGNSFYKRRRIIIEREEEKEEEPEVIVRKVRRLIARKITNRQIAQKVQEQVVEAVQLEFIDLTQAQRLIDDLKQQEILARMRRKQMQDDEEAIQFFL